MILTKTKFFTYTWLYNYFFFLLCAEETCPKSHPFIVNHGKSCCGMVIRSVKCPEGDTGRFLLPSDSKKCCNNYIGCAKCQGTRGDFLLIVINHFFVVKSFYIFMGDAYHVFNFLFVSFLYINSIGWKVPLKSPFPAEPWSLLLQQ